MISNYNQLNEVPSLPFKDIRPPSLKNRKPLRNLNNLPMRNMATHEIETNKLSNSSKNTCNFG